ncbi:MAG: recombinase family protein [Labilithrix sp.]|nr:recombinase family protein [Labilithrix sp.]MBX3216624.1 recombinase family protein [Labilithrix sp.]
MGTRVVGYIRVSTDGQADAGISLEAQRAKLTAYTEAMDLDLVAIEKDAGEPPALRGGGGCDADGDRDRGPQRNARRDEGHG